MSRYKTNSTRRIDMNTRIAAMAAMFCAATAAANPTVTIDRVIQRWPWNNKVDVTYTVATGQDPANNKFYRMDFVAECGGTVQTIDGVHDVGASTDTGTHTVTWTLPDGIKATDCTLTARIYSADAPSGDDYMIINLQTGVVSYEGLMGSQAASNERYNNDASGLGGTNVYKTAKLVLRKVPCTAHSARLPNGPFASGYPTGDDVNYESTNGSTNWVTTLDYYIGIFPVTQGQLTTIMGSNSPSSFGTDDDADLAVYRPVNNVAHSTPRGSHNPATPPAPNDTNGKSFLERLNGRTKNAGCVTGFDMPTELMFEIAMRAGNTATFAYNNYTGTAADKAYDNAPTYYRYGNNTHTFAVGGKAANPWGLYDMNGNVYEFCLDDDSRTNLKDAPDPWTAAYSGSSTRYILRGGPSFKGWPGAVSRASYSLAKDFGWNETGFRVAYIAR